MNNDEWMREFLSGNKSEKINLIGYLKDIFESYNKNISHFKEYMEELINISMEIDDKEVVMEILDVICAGQIYQDTSEIKCDKFVENLDKVSDDILARYIDIISYSGEKKYMPLIKKYKDYPYATVKTAVRDALIELGEIKLE